MNKVTKGLIAVLIALFALSGIALAQRPTNSADPASNSSDRAVLVGSDALVGSTVRDSSGADVGKVSRLMIDPADGHIVAVVVATGGKFGMGGSTISVPWNTVKVSQDKGRVVVVASQTLEVAPKAEAPPNR